MPCTDFLMLSLSHKGSHRACCSLSSKNTAVCACVMILPNEAKYRLTTQDLSWDLVTRHPQLSIYRNSRFPERKQNFGINHTVCMNSRGIVGHTFKLGNSGNFLEIQVPRLQPRANLVNRSFKGEQSQACRVNPSLGTHVIQSQDNNNTINNISTTDIITKNS